MTEFRPQRFQILPPAVKNLIIINALLLLLSSVLEKYGIRLSDYLGLHYWRSHYFRPWQLLTHLFLHGNFTHLLSNMFALWMFGSLIENIWGTKRFLVFYFICGVGAALCHLTVLGFEFGAIEKAFAQYQLNPTVDQFGRFVTQYINGPFQESFRNYQHLWESNPSNTTFINESSYYINLYIRGGYDITAHGQVDGIIDQATVGASGAIFGVLFAFAYLFPNMELYIYFLFPLKAKYFVALYAIVELFAGIQNSAGDNVAHFAHLGGMLFAFILLRYWQKNNRRHFY
ncbi:rhomboid family intramembrane serine protease [Rurimicrobium arvi]|uniref:Rhomboid family intramembrane serine protease n=1 Tax=Rurimicrobium arvi TaxID=2049916 RepID=A0ABP8MI59_9BACT